MIEHVPTWVRLGRASNKKYYTVAVAIDGNVDDYQFAPNLAFHDSLQMKDIWTALRKQVRERFDDSFHKHPRVAIFVTCKKEDSLQAVTAIVAITFRDALCKCLNLPTSPQALWFTEEGMHLLHAATGSLTAEEMDEYASYCDTVVWRPGNRSTQP